MKSSMYLDFLVVVIMLLMLYLCFFSPRCIMALIQGSNGLCPCPVCLVPKNEQRNISGTYPLRIAANIKMLVDKAENCQTEAEKEEILKTEGIHSVSVSAPLSIFIYLCIDSTCHRTLSGILQIQTHMKHYLSIECIGGHMALAVNIYGQKFRCTLRIVGRK